MSKTWWSINILLAFTVLAHVGCGSDSSPSQAQSGPSGGETRDDIFLTFTLDGGEFDNEEFDVQFGTDLRSRNVNYWISYVPEFPDETNFSFDGRHDDWDVDMDIKVPMKELGVHEFQPDETFNSNTNFDFWLQQEGEDERTHYYAQSAQVELTDYDEEYITGTFSGRFYAGSATTPEEEREYVTLSDGRFKINWAEGQRSENKAKW